MTRAAQVLESGKHPGQLKDAVASPAGTTIAGIAALGASLRPSLACHLRRAERADPEAAGFRGAAMAAVRAATRRGNELSKL
jgi:pyrroline-5-carboxylate reductase